MSIFHRYNKNELDGNALPLTGMEGKVGQAEEEASLFLAPQPEPLPAGGT